MTRAEAESLAAFIKDYDPRFEVSRAIYSDTPCVRALHVGDKFIAYYSIASYAEDARQKVHHAQFQAALEQWQSERRSRE